MNMSLAIGSNYSSDVVYNEDGTVCLSTDTDTVVGKWEAACDNTVCIRLPLAGGGWSEPMQPMPRSLADDFILTGFGMSYAA